LALRGRESAERADAAIAADEWIDPRPTSVIVGLMPS
jgi:hypothetical protein